MFFLLGGSDKKARKAEKQGRAPAADSRVREAFLAGRFPVVTTHQGGGGRTCLPTRREQIFHLLRHRRFVRV